MPAASERAPLGPVVTPPPRPRSRLADTARRIRADLSGFRADFWLAMAATALAAAVGLLLPWRMQIIVDEVFPDRQLGRVAVELLILLVIAGLSIGLSTVRRFVMERLCLRLIARARRGLFAHLLSVAPRRVQQAEGGQILSAFTSDLQLYLDAVKTLLAVTIPSAVFMLVYTGAMIWFSWQLSLFLVLVVVPLVVATNHFARRIHGASHNAQARFSELLGDISETLGGTREIKLFTMEERMQRNFNAVNERALDAFVEREKLAALHPFVVSLCVALGLAAIILFSVHLTNEGWIRAASLTGFIVSLGLAYPPLQEFSHSLGQLAQLAASRERLDRVLAIPSEGDTPPDPEILPRDASIRFRDVSFRYEAEGFGLDDITLDVAPGERVAIVGPSGAGKTSLIELLPRFIEPQSGEIRLGGARLQDMSLGRLRRHIGLVPQVPFVFRGSLLDNLRAGAPDAPRDKVIAVAREARVDEFAEHLANGYDTMIEPGGTNLSVGQRQRIAIARVLLKNPSVLLLDEPTSALDATSERLVGEAILRAAENRTTLIVAHRLSTVRDVDRIVVMQAGRIVEQGSHAALMERGGLYAELFVQSTRPPSP